MPASDPTAPAVAQSQSTDALLELVAEQRAKLLNLHGALRCALATLDDNDEAGGAVELAADELQRVIDALDCAQEGRS